MLYGLSMQVQYGTIVQCFIWQQFESLWFYKTSRFATFKTLSRVCCLIFDSQTFVLLFCNDIIFSIADVK